MGSVNSAMGLSWLADPIDDFSQLNLSTSLPTSNTLPQHDGQPFIIPESTLAEDAQLVPWAPRGHPNPVGAPTVSHSIPMTPGQESLFEALLSLGHGEGRPQHTDGLSRHLALDPNRLTTVSEHFLDAEIDDARSGNNQEDLEGVVVIISRLPQLDPNIVSNALPFLLQTYAAWINHRTFEPLRMAKVARDFVFTHFEGGEEPRLALTLLVNIGGKLAKTNRSVTSNVWKNEAIKALEATLEVNVYIVFGLATGFPQLFQYETRPSIKQPAHPPTSEIQIESGAQRWDGYPDRLIILFARIVSELEGEIHDFQPFQSSSNESALTIIRLMVQECWRQVAYIYLYMAFCGESSQGIRVRAAMKQLMNLVNGTKPGHFPDEFLKTVLTMAAPAARRRCDRKTIVKRQIGQFANSPEGGTAEHLPIIRDYWARADAELRPVVWSDVAISRSRVLGV
ncbi:hypothetical protein B0J17DRAFT_711288 [Rhizoctonia solani]|nr:hypothetical protein B0J17DRAFT_711288 [Rhizoctonia solani]